MGMTQVAHHTQLFDFHRSLQLAPLLARPTTLPQPRPSGGSSTPDPASRAPACSPGTAGAHCGLNRHAASICSRTVRCSGPTGLCDS